MCAACKYLWLISVSVIKDTLCSGSRGVGLRFFIYLSFIDGSILESKTVPQRILDVLSG